MPERQFLVVMTAHVPDGIPAAQIDEVRRREAVSLRELAAREHLLRLWRPASPSGEGRTVGLFAADDERQLDELLSSMPLSIWRTDEFTELGEHPNDPLRGGVLGRPGRGPEFLVEMTVTVPSGTPGSAVEEAYAREATRARDLAARGHLVRLWALPIGPDGPRTLGLWRARDPGELMVIVESLPLSGWLTIETTPLSPHPNDPIRLR